MLLVVLIFICCAVFVVWSWIKSGYPSPPVFPGALPLIGHAHLLLGDGIYFWKLEKKMYQFSRKNGGLAKFWIGPVPLYVITDLEDSLVVAKTCYDKPYVFAFTKPLFGRGLVTADGLTWKRHRKLLNPAYNQQMLNMFIHEFNEEARNLVPQLDSKVGEGLFDVKPYMINNSFKTVCRTSLGMKSQDSNVTFKNYTQAFEDIFVIYLTRFQKCWLHLPYIFNRSSLKKEHDVLVKTINDISNKVIKERKSELMEKNNNCIPEDKFKPLLDQMMDLADKKDAFTDDEVRDHMNTVVAASYDTTAINLTFALITIGSYQDVQDKIFKELQEVLGDEDRDLNKYDLPKLVYMEAVIKENLRLHPPAPRIGRCTTSSVKLKNYTLPANAACLISLADINRLPIWGADADQFIPERWLDPARLPADPNAFASFSLGKRNCIGRLYAIMNLKITLAHILRRYRVTGDIRNVKTRCDILLKLISGDHISLELRTDI